MICYWETSQRPLIIRTVWVKGHRHAILSERDQMKKSYKKKEDKQKISNVPMDLAFATDCHILTSQQNILQRTSRNSVGSTDKTMNINFNTNLQQKNIIETNPLSERVLQWLDLAGQTSSKYIEKPKYSKFAVRHSLPEVKMSQNELKLLKTDIEFEETNSNDSKKNRDYKKVKKYKISSMSTSPKSIKSEVDSRPDSKVSEYSLFDSDDDELSIEEEKPKKVMPREKFEFENNYINIIKKQIFESTCNTYVARKKLHIFIPSLPKKPASSLDNGSSVGTSNQPSVT